MIARLLATVPPAAGGAVMATGIVSIALNDDGQDVASAVLLGMAIVLWVVLGIAAVGKLVVTRRPASSPASLTAVAGTAVIGSRAAQGDDMAVAVIALVIAGLLALVLIPPVLRAWRRPTTGAGFLLPVSLHGLAALAGAVGIAVLPDVLIAVGLVAYIAVLRDFDLRELFTGRGDHWVAGGALAIAALALGDVHAGVPEAVVYVIALGWLPVLVAVELSHPRPGFDSRRWATVFPLGMYAAAGFVTGHVARTFADVWLWVAALAWLLAMLATARRAYARATDAMASTARA